MVQFVAFADFRPISVSEAGENNGLERVGCALNEWYARRAKSAVTRTNPHEYAGVRANRQEKTQLRIVGV